jgi:ABC-type multidrug transport system permease subunit
MSRLAGAWFVARKDVHYLFRTRETLLWVFIMPILFFYLIGTITGGFAGGDGGPDQLAVVAGGEPGFLYDQLARRLDEQDLEVVPVAEADLAGYGRRLTVPADMTRKLVAGEQVELGFVRRGGGLGADFDEIRVQRAVYTTLADLVTLAQEGTVDESALTALNETPRALTLEVSQAGERQRIPSGFEQAVPGIMVMFTLLVMLTSGAVMLVIERREGLLRRLAATPLSRGSVVLGKWGGKLTVGLVQIAFALLAGKLLFEFDPGPRLPMVLVVMLAYAALTAAFGVLLGSLAKTEGQAVGLGVLGTNVLAGLGGCWWPIEITPQWMQKLAMVLPTGMTMDALHRLISFGRPAASALPHLAALVALALVAGWLATRFFRYE